MEGIRCGKAGAYAFHILILATLSTGPGKQKALTKFYWVNWETKNFIFIEYILIQLHDFGGKIFCKIV